MIREYVFDALVGEDREYAKQLLTRKSPLIEWIKYYFYLFVYHYLHIKDDIYRLFNEPLPLTPYYHEKV